MSLENKITLDEIEYEFTAGNFIKTKNIAMKLLGLLKGGFVSNGTSTNFDIGQILANIGTGEFREIEDFIIGTVKAKNENGEAILLNQNAVFNEHFNKYRKHYFQLIIEGAKFHFLDFLPDGIASKVNTLSLDSLPA